MFPLRQQLKTQWSSMKNDGTLVFYSCMIEREDVIELNRFVDDHTTPLTSISLERCKIDTRDERTLELLHDFFTNRSSIRKIALNTPSMSNERVADMLAGARDRVEGLAFSWSFARAATLNRHLVFEQMSENLQTLILAFRGLHYFSEMESDFAQTLPNMKRVEFLEFHGWTIRDIRLRELVDSINYMPNLRTLCFDKIQGLASLSLPVFGELGRGRTDQTNQLEELRLSFFREGFADATYEQITDFISRLKVPELKIWNCGLRRQAVRAIICSCGDPGLCRLSSFSLHDTAFGMEELELLMELLPIMNLASLEINQIVVSLPDRLEQFEAALNQNKTLRKFEFVQRHAPLPLSEKCQSILKRNQRVHYVDRTLRDLPMMDRLTPFLLTCAIAALLVEKNGITDVQRLLTNRITVLTESSSSS